MVDVDGQRAKSFPHPVVKNFLETVPQENITTAYDNAVVAVLGKNESALLHGGHSTTANGPSNAPHVKSRGDRRGHGSWFQVIGRNGEMC
jgi:hypothetical protein